MEDSQLEHDIQILLNLEHLFTEPAFICEIEELLNANLALFNTGELTHEAHSVYQTFASRIETKLYDFESSQGFSDEQLLELLRRVYEQDSTALTCFEYIIAAIDFEGFLEMMLKRKQFSEWESTGKELDPKETTGESE